MKKLLLLLWALPLIATQTLKLPNGLQVMLVPRDIPAVFLTVYYRAGTFLEPEGKHGLSYLTGMLSFAGSRKTNPWEQIFFLERVGGTVNVDITRDFVIFESYFPREEFPLGLWYEHERMKPLSLSENFFKREREKLRRDVLLYENNEDFKIYNIVYSLLYANSPYEHIPLGIDEGITLGDVEDFHKKYFQPSTAFMVIIGKLGAKERALVTKMFSSPSYRKVIFPERVGFQARNLQKKLLVKGLKRPVYARCYRLSAPTCERRFSLEMAGLYLEKKLREQALKSGLSGELNVTVKQFVYSSALCVLIKGGSINSWMKLVQRGITRLKISPVRKAEFSGLKLSYIRELREKEINPEKLGRALGEYYMVYGCSQEEILGGVSLLTPDIFWRTVRKSLYPFNRIDVVLLPWEKKQ